MQSMQYECGVSSLKCAVCSIGCAVCSVQCAVCSVQCEVSGMEYKVDSVKCTVYSIKGIRKLKIPFNSKQLKYVKINVFYQHKKKVNHVFLHFEEKKPQPHFKVRRGSIESA